MTVGTYGRGRGQRCAEWGSVFLTLQSGDADVMDIAERASIKDLALKKVRAERPAGPRPSDGGAPGGGQRAQAPFIVSCAHIPSRPASLLLGLGVLLN